MAPERVGSIALISFPRVSRSIDCSPSQQEVAAWALERIREIVHPFGLLIGVFDQYMAPEIRRLPSDLSNLTFNCSSDQILKQLLEGTQRANADRAIICEIGVCAFERDWLHFMLQRHLDAGVWLTTVEGLSDGVAPTIVERKLLELAASVPFQEGWTSAKPMLQHCLNIAKQSEFPMASGLNLLLKDFVKDRPMCEIPARFEPLHCSSSERLLRLVRDEDCRGMSLLSRCREIEDQEETSWPAWRTDVRTSRYRILYVSNPSAYSGAEEAICNTILSLEQSKFEIFCLLSLEGHFAQRLRQLGAPVYVVGHDFSFPSAANAAILARHFDYLNPHIVHVNSPSGPLLEIIAHLSGAKVVEHLRLTKFQGTLDTLWNAHRVIAVSRYVAALAQREGVPRRKINVLYDAVDEARFAPPSQFRREAAKRRLGLDSERFVAVMVARFVPSKRHDLLLEAMNLLPKDFVVAVLVGESLDAGGWEAYIGSRTRELGLEDQVKRLGFQAEIEAIHEAADVAVLCSTEEPLGMAIIEAMAMGIPAVVCGGCGLSELVDETCGAVVGSDPASLADALFRIGTDRGLRTQMGIKAREKILHHCSVQAHAKGLTTIYSEVLGMHR